ncbi:MAG: hypothetical protein AB7K71_07515 [Polyangiaceae bacterium]
MAKVSKLDKLITENRNIFTGFGEEPDIEETVDGDRYSYTFKGQLFTTMEIKGDRFHFELLVTDGDKAEIIDEFKSSRMAFKPIKRKSPKGTSWFAIDVKADTKDLLESQISDLNGSLIYALSK